MAATASSSSSDSSVDLPRASDLGRRLAATAETQSRGWEADVPHQINAAVEAGKSVFDIYFPVNLSADVLKRQVRKLRSAGYTVVALDEYRQELYIPQEDTWLNSFLSMRLPPKRDKFPDVEGVLRITICITEKTADDSELKLLVPRWLIVLLWALFAVLMIISNCLPSTFVLVFSAFMWSLLARDETWEKKCRRLESVAEKNLVENKN